MKRTPSCLETNIECQLSGRSALGKRHLSSDLKRAANEPLRTVVNNQIEEDIIQCDGSLSFYN